MTWRESLRRVRMPDGRFLIGAAFRGVPFYVDSSERYGGRRLQLHEFPLRDEPFGDDLGRRARVFRLTGYVLGDGYLVTRDELLSALEDEDEPGQLIHPYYGKRIAVCTSLAMRETTADGGMAVFDLEFTETPAQDAAVTELSQFQEQVSDFVAAALSATDAQFLSVFNTENSPSFAVASLSDEIKQRANEMRRTMGPITQTTRELAELDVEIQVLVGAASTLVRTPSAILSSFTGVIENLTDTAASVPRKLFSALLDVYRLSPIPDAIGTSATREQERTNQGALLGFLRRVFLIEAARLLADTAHDSIEQAFIDRDALLDLLDEQLQIAGDGDFPALMNLRASIVANVPGDRALARILTITRPAPTSSLVLAYQLYGSVESEGDIVARNSVQHPGFLPTTLQVLSDAE